MISLWRVGDVLTSKGNGTGEVRDGTGAFILPQIGLAPAGVGVGVVGIEPDHLSVVANGPVVLAPQPIGIAPVGVGSDVLEIEADRLSVVGNGPVVLALPLIG